MTATIQYNNSSEMFNVKVLSEQMAYRIWFLSFTSEREVTCGATKEHMHFWFDDEVRDKFIEMRDDGVTPANWNETIGNNELQFHECSNCGGHKNGGIKW